MSETQTYDELHQFKQSREKNRAKGYKGLGSIAMTAVALVAVANTAGIISREQSPTHSVEYTVKPGDTESSIGQRFMPNIDPREAADKIDSRLPNDSVHANRTLHPGETIEVPSTIK